LYFSGKARKKLSDKEVESCLVEFPSDVDTPFEDSDEFDYDYQHRPVHYWNESFIHIWDTRSVHFWNTKYMHFWKTRSVHIWSATGFF
jgi:hypothetical protein